MKIKVFAGLLLAVFAAVALAQSPRQVRNQAEASMVVTGHVDVEADGTVSAHGIDGRDGYPDYVLAMVDNAAPTWRFEPVLVNGEPVAARAKMSLRLVARPVGDGGYEVYIDSGRFGDYSDTATDRATKRTMDPPLYPHDMVRAGAQGTAYVLLKIGRDGSVEEALVERVNLRTVGNDKQMERMRRSFSEASLRAARGWTFNPPTTGELVDDDFWVARIPVEYNLSGDETRSGGVGSWQRYIPGPRAPQPAWVTRYDSGSDAVEPGGIAMLGNERRLLTPLGGG